MSLSSVREKHSLAMQDVENGIDPGYKQKDAKTAAKAAPDMNDLLDEFWKVELRHKKSAEGSRNLLLKDVLPVWGHRKALSIARRDAVVLLDKVRERATSFTAVKRRVEYAGVEFRRKIPGDKNSSPQLYESEIYDIIYIWKKK